MYDQAHIGLERASKLQEKDVKRECSFALQFAVQPFAICDIP